MEKDAERGFDWVGLPVIATVARLLCQDLTLQNEYLLLENRILKEKVSGRIRFTDEERRSLTAAALALGRSLMKEVVSIVKPETILAWQRRLERWKWDYSARRTRNVRKSIRHPPRIPGVLGEVDAIRPAWPCWMEDLRCTVLRWVDWRENKGQAPATAGLSPRERAARQRVVIEIGPFAAFFSCLSRRLSLMLFFFAVLVLSLSFGDLSPIVRQLLSDGR